MRNLTSSSVVRRCTAAVRITPHRRAGRSSAGIDGSSARLQHVPGDRRDVRVGAVQVGRAGRDGQVAVEGQRLGVPGDQRVAQADRESGSRRREIRSGGAAMSACRALSASAVNAATSAGVPRLARISASSRATSAGWMPAWAYLVRDWRSLGGGAVPFAVQVGRAFPGRCPRTRAARRGRRAAAVLPGWPGRRRRCGRAPGRRCRVPCGSARACAAGRPGRSRRCRCRCRTASRPGRRWRRWPNRSTRPSRCSCRVGFQARS